MIERLRPWGWVAVVALFLGALILGGTVDRVWVDIGRVLAAIVILRWLVRWVRGRHAAGPGLRGFVPHKTPWAP